MLEGLKKSEEDLLNVQSYGEPLGEAILQRMHKLESKRLHFFSLKNQYSHGRTGLTIAAGPGLLYDVGLPSYCGFGEAQKAAS